jgi:Flp pilus assembly pilin Flp
MFADALNRVAVRLYLAMRREEGQTFVEYGMIGVVIAVGLAVTLGLLHTQLDNALNDIKDAIPNP